MILQGKVLKEKESQKKEWKQRITKAVMDAGETVKTRANKVSDGIRRWWKAKKAAVLKKNSKSGKGEL